MLKAFISVSMLVFAMSATAGDKIEVNSDTATYGADGQRAQFDGNVVVNTDGVIAHADRVLVSVYAEGNIYQLSGSPVRAVCAECADFPLHVSAPEMMLSDEEESLTIPAALMLCAGEAETCERGQLQADYARWLLGEEIAELRGSPVRGVWRPDDGGAPVSVQARRIEYNRQTDSLVMEGDAVASRDGEEIRGEVININIKTGALAVESNDDSGRVRGVFGGDE